MAQASLKQLLEAGVHVGHQTSRWNPKMRPYIFTARNGIHIIDLQKTVRLLDDAYTFVRDIASTGRPVLFVGTKKQAQETIQVEAARSASSLPGITYWIRSGSQFESVMATTGILSRFASVTAMCSLRGSTT